MTRPPPIPTLFPPPPLSRPRMYRDLARRWHGRAGRITLALGPNAFQRCSPRLVATWRRLGDELGLPVHTHLVDRKSTRLNSSHLVISYAVFCLKKKKKNINTRDLPRAHLRAASPDIAASRMCTGMHC